MHSGGIPHGRMHEVAPDALGQLVQPAQATDSSFAQRAIGAHSGPARHSLLELGVEQILGIELGARGRRVEHLDLVGTSGQLRLDRAGVVHPKVVQDQKHHGRGVFDHRAAARQAG